MNILQSHQHLSSQHEVSRRTEVSERWRSWQGPHPPAAPSATAPTPSVRVSWSPAALAEPPAAPELQTAQAEAPAEDGLEPRMRFLAHLVSEMTGLPVRVFNPNALGEGAARAGGREVANGAGWGLEYDRTALRVEVDTTRVQAQGTVLTADGREIQFSLDLQMSRVQVDLDTASLRAGDAARPLKDPLVLHFDGPVAALSDTRFEFDLDADGDTESPHFVGAGSGFLVFDRNRNGTVDDGRELLGATTGDGFAELAALDGDRNGWIAEGDAAFDALRVWRQDVAGARTLDSLAQAGVGALSLARVASPFTVRDAQQQLQGQVRATGLYLRETGEAGALQHIDLSV